MTWEKISSAVMEAVNLIAHPDTDPLSGKKWMKSILVDAGPLIALFDRDDRFHGAVTSFLREYRGELVTSWSVVTETSHMLDFDVRVQVDFLLWISRGGLRLVDLGEKHLEGMIELTEKYSDRPMNLADATLVALADDLGVTEIITIDNDYYIYRTNKGRPFDNLLQTWLD